MQACIVETAAPWGGRDLLGVSVLGRAAFALVDAGASVISADAEAKRRLGALVSDGRLRAELRAHADDSGGERLIVRADAFVSANALRGLGPGACLIDDRGTRIAARVVLGVGQDPLAALQVAQPVVQAADGAAFHLHDPASFGRARRILLDGLIKPTDGPVSRHLNRHLSRAITRMVLPLGVTPNQMTVLVAIAGAAAACLAAQPGHRAQVLGAACYQLHSVIDGCDGELARLTRRFGRHGALIDSLVDDASNVLFFAGLSWGVAQQQGSAWPVLTGAITVLCYAAVAYLQYAVVLRTTGKGEKTAFWTEGAAQRGSAMRVLHALGRRDVFVLLILVAVSLGLAQVVVAAFPAMAIGALVTSGQRVRRMRAAAGDGRT